ncbi:MAG: hypothetical protein ACPGLV_18395, partial [Bacteroidia bacterium]
LIYAKNNELVDGLIAQLKVLRALQGPNGEIPSNFSIEKGEISSCSFGSLTPKFDGICWYIIAICELVKTKRLKFEEWKTSIENGFSCLETLEYNKKGLIYTPIGSDWADEYILSGYVLHVQVLRIWALKMVNQIDANPYYSHKIELIQTRLTNEYFNCTSKSNSMGYLRASISPAENFEIFDFASNVIYAFAFSDNKLSNNILNFLNDNYLSNKQLPPAFTPTILPDEKYWNQLKQFELFGFKNEPGHYHNGGIWWVWLGWYANSLNKNNRLHELNTLKNIVSQKLTFLGEFRFCEYITPNNAEGGQEQMAFSAAGIKMIIDNN